MSKGMNTRTDPHRPGAIIPTDYTYIESYFLGSNSEDGPESYNLDVVAELTEGREAFGKLGKCGICGVNFKYGDIWEHKATRQLIHVGHSCADKYQMLARRPEFDAAKTAMERNHKARLQAKANMTKHAVFLAANPGLEEAFGMDHPILKDMSSKLWKYHSMSEKQVAFALRLAAEIKAPKPDAEKTVPAPVSDCRVDFEGIIVSAKSMDSEFGVQYKMTVKVTTPEGVWLAWGTAPRGLIEEMPCGDHGRIHELKGKRVSVTAGLRPGKDAHFAIMVRPNATVVTEPS